MAISLSGKKQLGQQMATSRKLAEEYDKQQRKESKRKGWSSMIGGVGGKLLGGALTGALGIASGGLLMPLIMGASTTMSKKWVDEATKKMGMGAKTGGLKGDVYGYGKQEAKTMKEGLEESMKTPDWKKSIGKDIGLSLVSAGAAGKLGKVKGALKGGEGAGKGLLMGTSIGEGGKEIIGTGMSGFEGLKSGLGETIGLKETFGGKPDEAATDVATDAITDPTQSIGQSLTEEEYANLQNPLLGPAQESELQGVPFLQQGGQVPNQEEQLMQLLALVEAQNPTAYDNTPLEEEKQQTISDYFGAQNKTLGGSNIKSLSQMLGR